MYICTYICTHAYVHMYVYLRCVSQLVILTPKHWFGKKIITFAQVRAVFQSGGGGLRQKLQLALQALYKHVFFRT
jgi:hypothetical protein